MTENDDFTENGDTYGVYPVFSVDPLKLELRPVHDLGPDQDRPPGGSHTTLIPTTPNCTTPTTPVLITEEPVESHPDEISKIEAEIQREIAENEILILKKKKVAAVKIQSYWRGFRVRSSAAGRGVRGHIEGRRHVRFAQRATTLEFQERREKAVEVEAARRAETAAEFERQKKIEIRLEMERIERLNRQREKARAEKVKKFSAKMRSTREKRSAKIIQKSWRHYRRVTRFRRNYAAKIIQKFWRNFSFHRRDWAATRIQLAYKAFRLRKRKVAVRVIERWYSKWCEIRRAREIGKV